METAKEMIWEAKNLSSCMGVKTLSKFQLYNNEIIKDSKDYDFLKSIMLDKDKARELFEYGKSIGQEVFFSVMFEEAVDWCEEIGVKYYKIRHYDRHNKEIIEKVGNTKKTFFISMNEKESISERGLESTILEYHTKYKEQVHILYCVPKYPAMYLEYPDFSYTWDGISDHTPDLCLFLEMKERSNKYEQWFERHVCLDRYKDTCLEKEWSSSFSELAEVLK